MNTVTLPARTVWDYAPALATAGQAELPYKLSYAIGRTFPRLLEERRALDAQRQRILAEQGDKTEAQRVWDELLDAEIEVQVHQVPGALLAEMEKRSERVQGSHLAALFELGLVVEDEA